MLTRHHFGPICPFPLPRQHPQRPARPISCKRGRRVTIPPLFESAEIAKFTPQEKTKYENDMTTERDIQNQIDFAHDKGIAEGIEKGIEQGIEKGIEKGVAQRNAEIARAMLSDGVAPDLIAKYSGLSAEEIDSLR